MNKNSTNPECIPAYSVYYRKRLQTHTNLALETPSQLENIISLIESQIKPHSHKHNLKERKYHRTLQRLRAIKDEQLSERESLRSTIQEKMNTSMRSLEEQKIKRVEAKAKKEEERKRKLEKIRSMERTLFTNSFSQSQMNSKESEKYLLQRQGRKIGKALGQICTPVVSRSTNRSTDSQLSKDHSTHSRILPSVFKVTASDLMKKKAVKVSLETDAYNRHLLQHIQKLTKVSLNRQKRAEFIKNSKEKSKEKEHQPKQKLELMPKCKMRLQSHVKSVQQSKESFSQSYSRCLKETQSRKFKIEVDFRERYQHSMNQSLERNKQHEIKKIVKESLNEIDRRCNYKLMQKSKGILIS